MVGQLTAGEPGPSSREVDHVHTIEGARHRSSSVRSSADPDADQMSPMVSLSQTRECIDPRPVAR